MMRSVGMALTIIGTLISLFSFTMRTTVGSANGDLVLGTTDVINIGLLQQQMMVFQGGCALALIGAIFWGATIAGNAQGKTVEPS